MTRYRREDVRIRPLEGHAEMAACVELQRITWGAGFAETVPPAILFVAQRTGGIASGAFASNGTLLGFVFGISGVEDNRLIHWSDMLAVHPDARGLGLGVELKLHQRALLLERGIERVYWTFDPLEARNAHINFRRLGVIARRYMREVYGDTGSDLHAGIGTDRLLAEWEIGSARVSERLAGRARAPVAGAARIEVPLDIQVLKTRDPAAALEKRTFTRAAFEDYLGRGWTAVDVERTADALHYLLVPPGTLPAT